MTLIDWLKAKKTLCIIAAKEGCSMGHIRQSIQECIDEAWNKAWTPGNIRAQVQWQQLFPGGMKPSVEEFIVVISKQLTTETYESILK